MILCYPGAWVLIVVLVALSVIIISKGFRNQALLIAFASIMASITQFVMVVVVANHFPIVASDETVSDSYFAELVMVTSLISVAIWVLFAWAVIRLSRKKAQFTQ
jgi:hypothetical protein